MSSHESYQSKHAAPEDIDEVDEETGRHRAPRHSEGAADAVDGSEPRHLNDEYEPQHSIEDETKDDSMSPEEREALAEDERNRYTDRELLHGSRAVAAAITEHGVKATSGALQAWAAVRNGVTSPRRGFHNFLVSRAEKKVAKRERKLGMAQDRIYKEDAQASLDKAQSKLETRQEKQGIVAGNATSRIESAKNYRSSEHQDFVNHLMDKKGAAVLRKEMRHRLRDQGAGRLKSRRLAREIAGSDNAKHAIDLALVTRATQREYKSDLSSVNRHSAKYEGSTRKIQTAERKHDKASAKLNQLTHQISDLEDMLPEAQEKLNAVAAELKDIDKYDPRRIDAETRYDAAGKAYHRYDAEIRHKKLEAGDLRRQMQKQLGQFEKHTIASRAHGENRRVADDAEHRSREHYRNTGDAASDALDDLMNPKETLQEPEKPETQETEE